MSKLTCKCGHTIADQTDNVAYKARFYRDQDFIQYFETFSDDIASFIEAVKLGHRDDWLKNYFSNGYPTDISNSSIIFDVISRQRMLFESDTYQCEECGRVQIQIHDKNIYASFKPEDNNSKDIFKGFTDIQKVS